MPKHALIILATGFEEIEAITIIDLLRRADVAVTITSITEQNVTGSHAITVIADTKIEECKRQEFDIIILPGGQPGTNNLIKSNEVKKLLNNQFEANKLIAAICAAPTVLEKAGLTKGKRVTSYPGEKGTFLHSEYSEDRVVQDGNIITSRAVGTAIDFSLYLIKTLCGKIKAVEIKDKILYTTHNRL